MKLSVTIDGENCLLELERGTRDLAYRLEGVIRQAGAASVAEVSPGTYSVLLGTRTFTTHIISSEDGMEVWIGKDRSLVSFADTRDQAEQTRKQASQGPLVIRALMPGRIVRLLVKQGERVQPEQGLIVVEAMKMQNEMKAPREGAVSQIFATVGGVVAAGEKLLVIE